MTGEYKSVSRPLQCMFAAMGGLGAAIATNEYTPWWVLFLAAMINSFLLTFCYIMGREDYKRESQ